VTYVTYVTVHTHTDGPIPGPHSLLTLSCAALGPSFDNAGNPDPSSPVTKTLQLNIEEIRGAAIHLKYFEYWHANADDWLSTRRLAKPPAVAMGQLLIWLDSLNNPTLAVDPTGHDYLFLYWYLLKYAGIWPFTSTSYHPTLCQDLPAPPCMLKSCSLSLVHPSRVRPANQG
jgi:hypothetical protein